MGINVYRRKVFDLNNRYFQLGLVGIRSVVSRNGGNNSTRFGIFILAPIMGGIRATSVAKLLNIEA